MSDGDSPVPCLAPGTVVAERYRVESVIGEGGMGIVYLVEHVHMRKPFALKVLHGDVGPEIVGRFEREAVAAGVIDHPNVVRATDFGRLPDGSFFLVLEYAAGRSLRKEIEAGPLEPARALRIARGIAAAVGAAHAKGVIHRDLKPENIVLVERNGDHDFVKVLDFGIAKVTAATAEGGQILTRAGAVFGTPDYMSPEQAVGQPVDKTTDLYSLGVILFELLTGERPFRGGAITVLRQHVLADAPPLPDAVAAGVDPKVAAILGRLLAKTPEGRYADSAELSSALDELLAAAPKPLALARTEIGPVPESLGLGQLALRLPRQLALRLPRQLALRLPTRLVLRLPRRVVAAAALAFVGALAVCAVSGHGEGDAQHAAAALDVPPPPPVLLPKPPPPRALDIPPPPSATGSGKAAGHGGGDGLRSLGQKIRSLF